MQVQGTHFKISYKSKSKSKSVTLSNDIDINFYWLILFENRNERNILHTELVKTMYCSSEDIVYFIPEKTNNKFIKI